MDELRVLVVGDEPGAAADHAGYVRRVTGFEVTGIAASAREALRILARHDIDLVLLDLGLPGGHGLEVARLMRATGATADIMTITAARDVELFRAAVSLGAVGYLLKPVTRAAGRLPTLSCRSGGGGHDQPEPGGCRAAGTTAHRQPWRRHPQGPGGRDAGPGDRRPAGRRPSRGVRHRDRPAGRQFAGDRSTLPTVSGRRGPRSAAAASRRGRATRGGVQLAVIGRGRAGAIAAAGHPPVPNPTETPCQTADAIIRGGADRGRSGILRSRQLW